MPSLPSLATLAVAVAVVLLLLTPMLDPLVSFGLALTLLAGLLVVTALGTPHRPVHR
jgi:hypothetical protein